MPFYQYGKENLRKHCSLVQEARHILLNTYSLSLSLSLSLYIDIVLLQKKKKNTLLLNGTKQVFIGILTLLTVCCKRIWDHIMIKGLSSN